MCSSNTCDKDTQQKKNILQINNKPYRRKWKQCTETSKIHWEADNYKIFPASFSALHL